MCPYFTFPLWLNPSGQSSVLVHWHPNHYPSYSYSDVLWIVCIHIVLHLACSSCVYASVGTCTCVSALARSFKPSFFTPSGDLQSIRGGIVGLTSVCDPLFAFCSHGPAASFHCVSNVLHFFTSLFSFAACCRHNILFCIRSHCNGYMVLHHDYMCVCVFCVSPRSSWHVLLP